MGQKELRVVLCTFPNGTKAKEVAHTLVTEGLIACANITPEVASIYTWKGEIVTESEVMCVMKTEAERIEPLRSRLVDLHPYEIPEFVVLIPSDVHKPYADWVFDATSHPPGISYK